MIYRLGPGRVVGDIDPGAIGGISATDPQIRHARAGRRLSSLWANCASSNCILIYLNAVGGQPVELTVWGRVA
jgi:hypothetical protein